MATVTLVMVMVTSLVVMASTDMASDMRELRGELEQLRSEVRRCSEAGEEDNTKILVDWLTDQVKEIQAELRSVVTKLTDSEAVSARREELELVTLAMGRLDRRVREMRISEERQGVRLEEVSFDLNHLKPEKQMNNNLQTFTFEKKSRKYKKHKHLTKKHLASWMSDMEERNDYVENVIQLLQKELTEVKSDCVSS